MKAAVTGANGGLGLELASKLKAKGWECVSLTRKEASLQTPADIKKTLEDLKPEIVFHCAAMTAVDLCETERETAFAVNVEGTKAVASATQAVGAKIVFMSTDYVFDGKKEISYVEDDAPSPLNVYGRTKLEGEKITAGCKGSLIIRTSWLYGKAGNNFVKTMLSLSRKGGQINVVNDQTGTPTYYPHLADGIISAIENSAEGILNITNSGSCSWYEFAKAIFKEKGLGAKVVPVSSEQFASAARRPKNSTLDCSRYEEVTGKNLPHWQEALKEYLRG